jgi:alpha-beta hydrolase superfamily lysophospholipase
MPISAVLKATLLSIVLIPQSFASFYRADLSLDANAELIADKCSSSLKDNNEKSDCFLSATMAYKRYLNEVAGMDDDFLTASIQGAYADKVVVATHSYTMTPEAAQRGIDYAYDNGATGLYVSLLGHRASREDDSSLRKVKGKDWISDSTLMTKIAQGFGDNVVLMGFSLGGILSIQQAKAYPQYVSGYIAMAPSFHGGVYLPYSEKSCFARIGLVRKIAESVSGEDLNNDFILGGCAIFSVSKGIARNIQNKNFATLNRTKRFEGQKNSTKRQLKNVTMPGVIIHSEADQVVSHQVSSVIGEILSEVAGDNFLYKKYDQRGPRHYGDHTYFDHSLDVSGFDAIDFVFSRIDD